MTTARDKIKAYHEAGHAVVARVLGIGITHVTIFSTGPGNSAVAQTRSAAWHARDADLPTFLAALEKDAKVMLAGPHAQHKYHPANSRHAIKRRDRNEWAYDLASATKATQKAVLVGRGIIPRVFAGTLDVTVDKALLVEAQHLMTRLYEETEVLVEEHWKAIERTAQALLTHRVLCQDDVDALLK